MHRRLPSIVWEIANSAGVPTQQPLNAVTQVTADQGQTVPALVLEAVLSSKMAAGICLHRTGHGVLLTHKPDSEMGESSSLQHRWTGSNDNGRAGTVAHGPHHAHRRLSQLGPTLMTRYGLPAGHVLALQHLPGGHRPVPTKGKFIPAFP